MKSLSAPTKKTISRFFKHPLLITLIGTSFASAVIPGIVGRSNTRAVRAKARIDQALEMMNQSNSVNTLLNKMKSEFEAFEKSLVGASEEDFQKRREGLNARISSLQNDFDSTAWSWAWNISYRARVLNLISSQTFDALQAQCEQYTQNLTVTSRELDAARIAYLRADSKLSKQEPKLMPGLDKRLRDLQSDRDALVRKMAEVFQ